MTPQKLKKKTEIEIEEKNAKTEKEQTSAEMNQEEIKVYNTQNNQEKEVMVLGKLNSPNKPPIYCWIYDQTAYIQIDWHYHRRTIILIPSNSSNNLLI